MINEQIRFLSWRQGSRLAQEEPVYQVKADEKKDEFHVQMADATIKVRQNGCLRFFYIITFPYITRL